MSSSGPGAGDTQPTQPLPEWAYAEPEPRRRMRVWPWIVAGAIVVGLAIVVWFAGESIARNLVEQTIRDRVVTGLDLPADQEIEIDVRGPVLPQLIAGRFDEISLSSEDVALGVLTGDVSVTARGVAFRGDASADAATATVSIDEEQLRALMSTVEGFPADTLGIEEPDVTMTVELSLFGISFPVGVALTPSASEEGDLVLTPASLQLAGIGITSDELKRQFGILSNAVLRDWGVCIRQYYPAGITLTDARVEGELLVAELAVDGRIVSDPALLEKGTCG